MLDNQNLLIDVNNEIKDIIDRHKVIPLYPDIADLTVIPSRSKSYPVKPALYIEHVGEDIDFEKAEQPFRVNLIYVSNAVTSKARDIQTMKVAQSLRRLLSNHYPKHLRGMKSLKTRIGEVGIDERTSCFIVLFACEYYKARVLTGPENYA